MARGAASWDIVLRVLAAQIIHAKALPRFELESSNLFGRGAGSRVVPFCADLDGDGVMDCLLGNLDGFVEHFVHQPSISSTTYSWDRRSTDFFSHDIGTGAAPFCMDFDKDGNMDCLVGTSHGFVMHFLWNRNTWTLTNSSVFGYDVGSNAKPFCADVDGDGLVDCLVGADDGHVYFMKRQPGSSLSFAQEGRFFEELNFGAGAAVNCIDVDGDGDLECLVGNSAGFVSFVRINGNRTWVQQTTNVFNQDVGSHVAPFCVDVEGTVDCFIGEAGGYVFLMKQRTHSFPHFDYEGVLFADVGSHASPSCADLDKDGDLDCFVGNSNGYVELFMNMGTGLPLSHISTSVFGSIVSSGRASPVCFAIDGDNSMDCLVGGSDGFVHHYRHYGVGWNRESDNFLAYDVGSNAKPFCFNATGSVDCLVGNSVGHVWHFRQTGPSSFQRLSTNFFRYDVGSYAAPACFDFDLDGRLDCLVGESGGYVHHFKNSTSGWVHASSDFFGRQFGSYASPFCADPDADGRLDCLVGEYNGHVHHMRARAKGATEYTWEYPNVFTNGNYRARPTCADMDGDGDIDCLVGSYYGTTRYYRRIGPANTFSFTSTTSNFFNHDVGSYAAPFCFDTDHDGDVDCLVGNSGGYVYHFINASSHWSRASTDYFSMDVGGHAAPFCVDMDGDSDLDCLVGNSGGLVHFFRWDATYWTHVSSDFFQYNVGGWASPFCSDIDGDGDMDCLVGESNGRVVHFENTGSGSSFKWSLMSRSYFPSLASYAAPFCLDIEGDGDIDCLVGKSDGTTMIFKAQEPSTTKCDLGSYVRDQVCVACSPGKYGTRSSSRALACETCPSGTTSDVGSTICRQTFTDWAKELGAAYPSAKHDGHGVLDMRIHVPPLPSDLHGGLVLAYSADLQGRSEAPRQNSSCAALWQTHPRELQLVLPMEKLDGAGDDCTMDTESTHDTSILKGNLVLTVRVANNWDRVFKTLVLPVEFHVPRQLKGVHDLGGNFPVEVPPWLGPLDPFASSLQVFQSASFVGSAVAVFQAGDPVYVQHSADLGSVWNMSLLNAWLTTSDLTNQTSLVANFSQKDLTVLPAPPGQVRFSFLALECKDCLLHVVSELLPASRRLLSGEGRPNLVQTTTQSLVLQIVPRRFVMPMELYGTLELNVDKPRVFAADSRSQQAVASALQNLLSLPAEVRVMVSLDATGARRLSTSSLSPNVRATYLIVMPPQRLSDGRSAVDIASSLDSATNADIEHALRAAVSPTYTVSVISSSTAAQLSRTPSSENGPLLPLEPLLPLDDGNGSSLVNIAVSSAGAVLGVLACAGVLLRQWLRSRRSRNHNGNGNSRSGCSLLKGAVKDLDLLGSLTALFELPGERCADLGDGTESDQDPEKQSQLVLKGVWSFNNTPVQEAAYDATKKKIAWQRMQVDQDSGPLHTQPTPALTDKVAEKLGMNPSCNEKLLLRGTKVDVLESLLRSGVDRHFISAAPFAEDPSKIGRYTEVDSPHTTDDKVRYLHRVLYEDHALPHPGGVYYALVCQVCLGCPGYTKGPDGSRGEGMSPAVANKLRQQLAPSPKIPCHSLVVEMGPDGAEKQHREFVLFDGKAVLVKYLVAYARE